MSAATVRRAGPADRDAVLALLALQFAEHRIDPPRAALRRAVEAVLDRDDRGFFLLAAEGGASVGVAYVSYQWSLEHAGRAAWLEELFVRPERRGAGIGRRLLDAALAGARDAGCAAVDLEVDRDHARAESLYRRAGFTALPRSRWVLSLPNPTANDPGGAS